MKLLGTCLTERKEGDFNHKVKGFTFKLLESQFSSSKNDKYKVFRDCALSLCGCVSSYKLTQQFGCQNFKQDDFQVT